MVTVGFFLVIWSMPHYAAPLTCVIALLLVASHPAPENHESVWPPGRRGAFPRGGRVARRRYGAWRRAWVCDPLSWACTGDLSRAAIVEKLSHTPGNIWSSCATRRATTCTTIGFSTVRKSTAQNCSGTRNQSAANQRLFDYFKDRQIWLIQPEEDNTELIPTLSQPRRKNISRRCYSLFLATTQKCSPRPRAD